MTESSAVQPAFKARPCPICGKPSQAAYKPFCSARCADIDLNRWFSGVYAVPAAPEEDEHPDDGEPRKDG